MRRFFVISLFLVILSCAAPAMSDELQTITRGGVVGCISKDDIKTLVGVAVTGDKEAYGKAGVAFILSGKCRLFDDGEQVQRTEVEIFSGLKRVRPLDETQQYWIAKEEAR